MARRRKKITQADLFFDPDLHPEDTLKQFDRFTNRFELRYAAQYPDPPKVSIDSAIERWKIINPDKAITLEDYDKIRDDWMSQDKVAKFLGMFSSPRYMKIGKQLNQMNGHMSM